MYKRELIWDWDYKMVFHKKPSPYVVKVFKSNIKDRIKNIFSLFSNKSIEEVKFLWEKESYSKLKVFFEKYNMPNFIPNTKYTQTSRWKYVAIQKSIEDVEPLSINTLHLVDMVKLHAIKKYLHIIVMNHLGIVILISTENYERTHLTKKIKNLFLKIS